MITGGSSGLGKAIASQLLKEGANIILIARNMEQLRKTAKSLESNKLSPKQIIEMISADVTDFESIKSAINTIETKLHKIDVLFSCAGTFLRVILLKLMRFYRK